MVGLTLILRQHPSSVLQPSGSRALLCWWSMERSIAIPFSNPGFFLRSGIFSAGQTYHCLFRHININPRPGQTGRGEGAFPPSSPHLYGFTPGLHATSSLGTRALPLSSTGTRALHLSSIGTRALLLSSSRPRVLLYFIY